MEIQPKQTLFLLEKQYPLFLIRTFCFKQPIFDLVMQIPLTEKSKSSLYDDKGRVIQVQSQNVTGGVDVVSTQYSWAGQPLLTVTKK